MLLPVICFIGCWFIAFLIALSLYNVLTEKNLITGFTFTFGSIAALLIWLIASGGIEENVTETTYRYKETAIISIKNDQQIHGEFFLGCGSIDEIEYYFFFKRNENGNLKREKIASYRAEICETDTKQPCIAVPYMVEHVRKSSLKHPKLWFFNTDDETKVWSGEAWGHDRIIYVPKGTVLTKFELY